MKASVLQNPHLPGDTFYYERGEIGALLIHGYTATTAEVRLLGDYLAGHDVTVSAPLLPGHGTTPEEMNRCRWQDWAAAVEEAYTALRARCRTVFVGGESMGGLLTLYLATRHAEIAGLMVYATALYAANKLLPLAPLLRYFIKALPKERKPESEWNAADRRWQGYIVHPGNGAAQLYLLSRHVRRTLSQVRQPILIMHGLQDDTVQPRSSQEIHDRVASRDKELVWLEHSTHCLLLDIEYELAAERTLAFIRRLAG